MQQVNFGAARMRCLAGNNVQQGGQSFGFTKHELKTALLPITALLSRSCSRTET
jgi:hypothetical protein